MNGIFWPKVIIYIFSFTIWKSQQLAFLCSWVRDRPVTHKPYTCNDSHTTGYSFLQSQPKEGVPHGVISSPLAFQGPKLALPLLITGFQDHPGSHQNGPHVEDKSERGSHDLTHTPLIETPASCTWPSPYKPTADNCRSTPCPGRDEMGFGEQWATDWPHPTFMFCLLVAIKWYLIENINYSSLITAVENLDTIHHSYVPFCDLLVYDSCPCFKNWLICFSTLICRLVLFWAFWMLLLFWLCIFKDPLHCGLPFMLCPGCLFLE